MTLHCHNEAVHGKDHCNTCLNRAAMGQKLPRKKPAAIGG